MSLGKKLLLISLCLAAILAILAVYGWWWLMASRGGAEWVLGRAAGQVEQLEWRSLDGGFAGGVHLRDVRFTEAGVRGEIGEMELAARVRLGRPIQVTVEWLRMDDVDLYLPPVTEPPEEPEPFELGDYRSPVEVLVREFRLDRARIHPAEGEALTIDHAGFSGSLGNRLRLEDLVFRMPPFELAGALDMQLDDPWTVDLAADLDWTVAEDLIQELSLKAAGPAADLRAEFTTAGPLTSEASARIRGLPDTGAMALEIDLDGTLSDWPEVDGRIENLALTASGGLTGWRMETSFDLIWPDLPAAGVEVHASGDLVQADIDQARIRVLDGEVTARGRIGLEPEPSAELNVTLTDLDFTELYPEWPDQARLTGGLEFNWDGALAVRNLELRAPPAELHLTGEADFDPASEQLALSLEWQALTWPPVLDGAEPLFSSESGWLRGSGTLSDWQAEIDALFRTGELPPGEIRIDAGGNAQSARIREAAVDLGAAGSARATGTVSWADGLAGELGLDLEDLDPGFFVPQLPGRLDAGLTLELVRLEPLSVRLDVARLDGELRGQPVSGHGGLAVTDDGIHRAGLELSVGANQLEITSTDGRSWNLELDATRLDHLWPDLAGQLELSASVVPAEGQAEWTARGGALGYRELRLAGLEMTGRGRWLESPSIDLDARLLDLDINPWERLEEVTLELSGDCARHELDFSMLGMRANLAFRASGRLPECLDDPRHWDGRIERLALTETLAGDWSLRSELPLTRTATELSAGPGCLDSAAGGGSVCLNVLELAEASRAEVVLESVPMDLVLLPTDPVFSLTSRLDGRLGVRWDEIGLEAVDSRLVIGPGGLRPIGVADDLLQVKQVELVLDSPAARSLNGRFDAELEADSRITGQARIPDLREWSDLELDAVARLELPDLGAFNRLVPELDQMAGRVRGELTVSGPLADPELAGRVAISEGLLLYAPLGMKLEELNLELVADEARSDLTGGFRAGGGRARIEGELVTGTGVDGWRAELEVTGEQLQLFDASWLRLTASPDLQFGLRAERLDLNGEILIDRARLGMPPGIEDRVPGSPDVVVIGEAEDDPDELPVRELAGTVTIRLSDDVRLSAAAMQTNLAGDLDLIWEPGQVMPRGRGIIRLVDGSYRAYGQNLEVDGGEVIFTRRPVDNPRLNIEAIRHIFGDPQVEYAGVRIRGPARNPQINLFTTPPTSQEKALAYVLTGSAFDPDAGQGTFSVGFWVLPRLFVSYGLGLFDTGNVLAARYELSRRWGVRATSGERDTGADISYLLER